MIRKWWCLRTNIFGFDLNLNCGSYDKKIFTNDAGGDATELLQQANGWGPSGPGNILYDSNLLYTYLLLYIIYCFVIIMSDWVRFENANTNMKLNRLIEYDLQKIKSYKSMKYF